MLARWLVWAATSGLRLSWYFWPNHFFNCVYILSYPLTDCCDDLQLFSLAVLVLCFPKLELALANNSEWDNHREKIANKKKNRLKKFNTIILCRSWGQKWLKQMWHLCVCVWAVLMEDNCICDYLGVLTAILLNLIRAVHGPPWLPLIGFSLVHCHHRKYTNIGVVSQSVVSCLRVVRKSMCMQIYFLYKSIFFW